MQAHEAFPQSACSILLGFYIQLDDYMHRVGVRQGLLIIEEYKTLKQIYRFSTYL